MKAKGKTGTDPSEQRQREIERLEKDVEDLKRLAGTAEADAELTRALVFYREVGAKGYVREGEALLAASA